MIAVAAADYQKREHIPITKDDRSQNAYGESSFDFGTGNGIYRSEQGSQNDGQNFQGKWSYTSPEGVPISLTFVADQGGYQPQGDHLPQPVPLPYNRQDFFEH